MVGRCFLQKLSEDKGAVLAHGVVWSSRHPNHLSKKKKKNPNQPHPTVPKRYHSWHPDSKHNRTCWAKDLKSVLQVSHLWFQWKYAESLGQEETVGDTNRGTERSADAQCSLQMGIPNCNFNRAVGFEQRVGVSLFVCCSIQLWPTAEETYKIQVFHGFFVWFGLVIFFFVDNTQVYRKIRWYRSVWQELYGEEALTDKIKVWHSSVIITGRNKERSENPRHHCHPGPAQECSGGRAAAVTPSCLGSLWQQVQQWQKRMRKMTEKESKRREIT